MPTMPADVAAAARPHPANYAELAGAEMRCGVCKGTFSNNNLLRNEEDETGGIICPCCGATLHVDSSVRINTPVKRIQYVGAGDITWPS